MATSAVSPATQVTAGSLPSDVSLGALAKALRHKREEAEALVRLVEQTTASSDKGQHVNYYG